EECFPVEVKQKRKSVMFERDEHIRPDSTAEALAKLRPVFKEGGVVTAGNASGINDGAAALVVASREAAEKRGLKPLGRLVSWGVSGCQPEIMGIGPAESSRIALRKAGLKLADMDLVEINEAFAAQYLAVEKELGLDRARTNVNGGAIAIGHPVGASGARLTLTLLHELRRRGGRYGLAGACIGGGMGLSIVVEALKN
ncbi:MAG: acetyl-CoA C-acyltransferase, partial [Candidatus Tectomicrobia bacterium]|nr:acetyl-CoA C-acyltransferase [Candidatus Tectomicrobia bacterium]